MNLIYQRYQSEEQWWPFLTLSTGESNHFHVRGGSIFALEYLRMIIEVRCLGGVVIKDVKSVQMV